VNWYLFSYIDYESNLFIATSVINISHSRPSFRHSIRQCPILCTSNALHCLKYTSLQWPIHMTNDISVVEPITANNAQLLSLSICGKLQSRHLSYCAEKTFVRLLDNEEHVHGTSSWSYYGLYWWVQQFILVYFVLGFTLQLYLW